MGKKSRLKKLTKTKQTAQTIKSAKPNNYTQIITYGVYGLTFIAFFYLGILILKPGIPAGHDIAAHYSRAKMVYEAITQGQFPVRWVEWTYGGASVPLFNFYQSGFYYLVFALHLMIPSFVLSIKVLVILLWWLGAGFMFLFMKRFGSLPAMVSALIFSFTPYIISDVFVRAAYPEFMAITFAIGLLWALDRLVVTQNRIFILLGAVNLGLVTISHLPTLLILSPVIGLYLLTGCFQYLNLKTIKLIAITLLLGIGLASFYLLPAMAEMNLIQSEFLTADYYDFHRHFAFFSQLISSPWGYGISDAGLNDGMSFQFGALQWLIIGLSILTLIIPKAVRKNLPHRGLLTFWLLMIPPAVFLMTSSSIYFWENFKFISFIQYPWRYLMIVALSSSCLVGLLVSLIKDLRIQAFVVVAVIAAVFVFYGSFLHPSMELPEEFFKIDSADWKQSEGMMKYTPLEKGYLPKGVSELPQSKDIPRYQIISGSATIQEKVASYDQLKLATESDGSFGLMINTHHFPGWKAFIDHQETRIDSNNSFGFMNIIVPPGIHQIEMQFTNTPIRSLANSISLFTLAGLLGVTIWSGYKKLFRS